MQNEEFTIIYRNRLEPHAAIIRPLAKALADAVRKHVRRGELVVVDGYVRFPEQSSTTPHGQ